MKGRFLIGSKKMFDLNIYAGRSSLVLDWLLKIGINRKEFALREVVKEIGGSLGTVQRVFAVLAFQGILQTTGVRTGKRFSMKNPARLLKDWVEKYNLIKNCKMWTYSTGFHSRKEMLHVIKKSSLKDKVALALHSAADAYGCKNNNLETLELYLLDPLIRPELEKVLNLREQERGYEVLVIEPYYKGILHAGIKTKKTINISPILLTFLDLFHFPLRGHEQAEFMGVKIPELKQILETGTK